jgi:CheY-like chemotaxis protein
VEQIVLNLVSIHASEAGQGQTLEEREVRLETRNLDGYVALSVSSSGPTAAAAQANIEFTASQSAAIENGGLIAIEEEHGRLCTTLLLPVWEEPAPAAPGDVLTHTLLLIEPRESVRTQLHNFFETAGYNLLEAADADEARALLDLHGAASPEPGLGEKIELVMADTSFLRGIEGVPVLCMDQPAGHALSQSELLERVRTRLQPDLTFSASAS